MAMYSSAGGQHYSTSTGSVGNTDYAQVSPTLDPTFAELLKKAQASIPGQMGNVGDMIGAGMASPLLDQILQPMLQRLARPQQQQQQQLTDAARSAGGLRGSPYMQEFGNVLQGQGQQRNDLMAAVLQQVLGPVLQAQLQQQRNNFLPAQTYADLLRASRPDLVKGSNASSSSSSGWENIPPSMGLDTPMSGDNDPINPVPGPTGPVGPVGPAGPAAPPTDNYDWLDYNYGGGSSGSQSTTTYGPWMPDPPNQVPTYDDGGYY